MRPHSYYYQTMEPVRRVYHNQYVSDLARFEQIKARRNRMSAIKHSAKHSLSDSGYDYEPFDEEYDEGFSISEDEFGDDDAWEDMYDGEAYSVEDEAFEDDANEGEGFSMADEAGTAGDDADSEDAWVDE
ncbi:hypothetical protein AMAG_02453 [Allomyces macrogynus ATCC 38327]|uniref:Uncharacterized protein n=1 Tax=Allomyces macrogynus (strain ATCC 38327) TaxID=578462 RepID=A0A0L0S2S8_ALLM3|nr:hypothetical protein AMAG_02453 [Allomyces macrogynus ATCC 38327]|eukprot:KNE56669.1 hypothetical protein AMAG_02453 [Allomyces macrogynus ATCC 38327]